MTATPEHVDTEGLRVTALAAGRSSRLPGWFVILWRNRKCRVGLLMLAAFVLVAVFAPVLAPDDPRAAEFPTSLGPTGSHWLGTTQAGQDMFSQLIYGARTSLIVGLVGGALATLIALVVGMTAGYMRRHGRRGAVVLHQPGAGGAGAAVDDRRSPPTRRYVASG